MNKPLPVNILVVVYQFYRLHPSPEHNILREDSLASHKPNNRNDW